MNPKNQVDAEGFLVCYNCGERKEFATAFRPRQKQCRDCNRERDRKKQAKDNAAGTRFCKRCEQHKDPSEFSPGNTQCRPCKAAYTAAKARNAKLPPEQRETLKVIGPNITRERKFDDAGNRWCWKCDAYVDAGLFQHDRTLCNPCYLAGARARQRAKRAEAVARGLPPRKNARQESGPKTCTSCGETKSFEAFRMSSYQCKQCTTEAYREKYWSAPDEYRAMFRERYAADAERQRARVLAYWAENPEIRAKNRRNWMEKNPGKYKAQQHRRRAREHDAPGVADYEALLARMEYYGHKCWMCRHPVVSALDHVKALCNGGSNWASNFRPACWECNSQKAGWERNRNLSPAELHNLPAKMKDERAKSSKPRREIETVYSRRKVDGGFARSERPHGVEASGPA